MGCWQTKLIILLSTFFICLISFDSASASFNPMINYQGKLTNNSDSPVANGTYNLKIRLCADSACSSVLWTEDRVNADKVQVTNGLFSILLGEVSTSSLSSINFNQNIYLELQVGGTGTPSFETLLPRKRFAAVPAAFEAANLGGLSSSAYAKLSTNETVSGAWNFNNLLNITANSISPILTVLQTGVGPGMYVGNGTATTSIRGNATSTFPYGATFATSGGNVGIGVANPTAMLDVAGTTNSKLFNSYLFSLGQVGAWTNAADAYTPRNFFNLGADWHGSAVFSENVYIVNDTLKIANSHSTISGSVLKIPGNGKTNQGAFVFYTAPPAAVVADAAYAGAQRFMIGSDGKISIGTGTAPAHDLSFDNTIARVIGIDSSSSSTIGRSLSITAGATTGGGTNIAGGDLIVKSGAGTGTGTSNILFQTATTLTSGATLQSLSTKATILGNGYFGIGTSSPSYLLSVAGDINTTGTIRINGADYGQYFISTAGLLGQVWQSDGSGAGIWTNTSSLGIMPGASPGQVMRYGPTGWEGSYDLSFNGSGYIGIGTSSASYKLDVMGDINSTGVLRLNGNNYSQYFIDSSGTSGSLWQSAGSGAGHWVTTSSLGLGGSSLPSGSLNQILTYGGSGWVSTSSLYLSGVSTFVSTSTFNSSIISDTGLFISNVANGTTGSGTDLITNGTFESWTSGVPTNWVTTTFAGNGTMVQTTTAHTGSYAMYFTGDVNAMDLISAESDAISVTPAASYQIKLWQRNLGDNVSGGTVIALNGSVALATQVYNFASSTWDSWAGPGTIFGAPNPAIYLVAGTPSITFREETATLSAPANGSLHLVALVVPFGNGSLIYGIIDDVSLTAVGGGTAGTSTAFNFNATNFSATSTTDTLFSVRSNNTEKFNLSAAGNLSLVGNVDVAGTYKINGADVGQYFINSAGTSGQIWKSNGAGSGSWVSTSSLGITPSGSSGQVMRYGAVGWEGSYDLSFNGSGYVGIGTSSASYKLDVMGDINTTGTIRMNGNDYGQFFISSAGTSGQVWQSDGSGAGAWANTSTLGFGNISGTGSAGQLSYFTNSSTLSSTSSLSWDSVNGRLGVGISPTQKFHVFNSTGNFTVYAQNQYAGTSVDEFNNAQAANYGEYVATTNGYIVGQAGYAAGGNRSYGGMFRAIVNKASATNIGVAGYALNGSAGGVQIGGYFGLQNSSPSFTSAALIADNGSQTSSIFIARDNGSNVFTVLDGGNIGIGTSTPSQKLDVWGGNILQTSYGNPTLKGSVATTDALGVYISGKYAYVADRASGLRIIDISNPSMPTIVGSVTTSVSEIAQDVYVSGKYAYLADGNLGLSVIDISIPSSPKIVGTVATNAYGVSVSGNYAYVGALTSGMRVIDISNPLLPVIVTTVSTTGASNISIFGNYAYVAAGSSGVRIVDISNPSSPVLIGTISSSTDAQGTYVSGKFAYVSDNASGLRIVDISNPASPVLVSTAAIGYSVGSFISGKYAYSVGASVSGMKVVDISSSTAPFLVGTIATTDAQGIFVSGKYAYVADRTGGFKIFDINGTDVPALNAGNISTNALTISENVDIGNNLSIRNALNVGMGGIFSNGAVAITVSTTISTSTLFSVGTTTPNIFSVKGNGYIGMGTSTPAYKLDVYGDVNLTGALRINGNDYGQYFITTAGTSGQVWQSDGSGAGAWVNTSTLGIMPSGSLGQIMSYGIAGWESNSNILFYQSNVGIGTSTPAAKLHVVSTTEQFRLAYDSSKYVSFTVDSNNGLTISPANSGTTTIANGLVVNTNSLAVDKATGYVGVGTTTPSVRFDVVGGTVSTLAKFSGTEASGAGVSLTVQNNDVSTASYALYQMFAGDANHGGIFFGSRAANNAYGIANGITFRSMAGQDIGLTAAAAFGALSGPSILIQGSTGNVGIGTTTPAAKLQIVKTSEQLRLSYDSADYSSFTVGTDGGLTIFSTNSATTTIANGLVVNTNSLVVNKATGNVGVGLTNPIAKFQVVTTTEQFRIGYDTSRYSSFTVGSDGGLTIFSTSATTTISTGLVVNTNSLVVNKDTGYVGVNTTSPTNDFTVSGNGYFALKREGFERSTIPPSGYTASGYNTTWRTTSTNPYAGSVSLQTPIGADLTSSTLTVTSFFSVSTTISFWWRVSSEPTFDYFGFCIDKPTCNVTGAVYDLRISSTTSWAQVTSTVSSGLHTFKWQYGKDSSAAVGSDAGFLDEVYIGEGGKVVLENSLRVNGNILVNTTTAGNAGYKIFVDSGSSSGAGIGVNGYIKASGFITGTTTLDLAETYPFDSACTVSSTCPESGDLVCSDKNLSSGVKKCSANSNETMMGVVSDNPGFLLGGSEFGDSQATNTAKIALSGRVPVKVNISSGTIKIGDELVLGDVDGAVKKSREPGQVIGVALENFGDESVVYPQSGKVLVFVNPHWSIGSLEEKDIPMELPDFSPTSTLTVLDKFSIAIENSLQKLGLVIKNGVAKLKEIIVEKLFVTQLCVGDTCIGEQQLKDMLDKNQIVQMEQSGSSGASITNSSPQISPPVVINESTSSFSSTEIIGSTEVSNPPPAVVDSVVTPPPVVDVVVPISEPPPLVEAIVPIPDSPPVEPVN